MDPGKAMGVSFPIFGGEPSEDWLVWRAKFEAVIENIEAEEPLQSSYPPDPVVEEAEEGQEPPPAPVIPTAEQKAWLKANKKIYGRLVLYTKDAPNALVRQYGVAKPGIGGHFEKDGKMAYQALIDRYEKKDALAKNILHKELFSMGIGSKQDPDIFFTSMEDKQRRLIDMGDCIIDGYLDTDHNQV